MLGLSASALLAGRKWLFVGLGAVAIGLVGFSSGFQIAAWKYGKQIAEEHAGHVEAQLEAERSARNVDRLQHELDKEQAAKDAYRRRHRELSQRYVQKQVIRYVETDNAQSCGLSLAGVLVHDAAVRNRVPVDTEPPSGANDRATTATNTGG